MSRSHQEGGFEKGVGTEGRGDSGTHSEPDRTSPMSGRILCKEELRGCLLKNGQEFQEGGAEVNLPFGSQARGGAHPDDIRGRWFHRATPRLCVSLLQV